MYTCAQLHPGLAALLEFEEQRLGIPVEVERKPLYNCDAFPTARPVIEVRIHTGTRPETFPVLLADELLEVTAPVCVEPGSQEVGFKDATGRLCPLASVIGNVVNVYFDLDEVFSFPVNVRRKPTNGGALAGHPGNRLAELIFSQALAIAVGNIRRLDWKGEAARYIQVKLAAAEDETRQWERDIRTNERSIEERTFEIQTLARKNRELRENLRLARLITGSRRQREAHEEHRNLMRLVGRSLRRVEVTDGILRCLTAPIHIDFHGVRYEFGCMWIVLPLGRGRLEILPQDQSFTAEGYAHPHIASDGAPCLGNIGPTLAQLRGEGKLFECVTLLLEFLRSYNPDNPYLRIERWDPDWEDDEDRYESCYDNASLPDCATCSDWDCPRREGAESRCFDYTQTDDCIACAGCGRHEDAIVDCRGEHAPEDCFACDSDCTYAGDATACIDVHDGDHCPDCPHDHCPHHQEEENEDEETPARSAAGSR